MSSMNSFTCSRPLQTRNMMDWNQPGEEASSCDITVHFPQSILGTYCGERNKIFIDGVLEESSDQVRRAEHS